MQHSLQGCRKRHAGLLALIILMAGCRNPAENGDPRACQQRTGISSPVGSRAPAKRDTRVGAFPTTKACAQGDTSQ